MSDLTHLKIFGGSSHPALTAAICDHIGVTPGAISFETFSCGERYVQIGESVRGANCFVVQTATGNVNNELIELFLIIDALKRSLAKYIHVVIPHFGYARQDKITDPREPISAKLMATLIERAGAKHIITLDLHSPQTMGFFEKPVDNLTAKRLFLDYFRSKDLKDAVVVSPDAGGAKNAEKFAKLLGTTLAILHKSRPAHNVAEIQHIIGDVAGRPAILFDDMIDTAGSVTAAATALRAAGTTDIYLAASHAVFSGPAVERLNSAPFKEIIVTDSIPHDYAAIRNCHVLSIAGLLGDTIDGIHTGRSVSQLWETMN